MYIFILIVCFVVIISALFSSKHFIKSFLLSALQGLSALFAVNFIGDFIGVHLALNWFSAAVSAAGGLPGVIFLLISDILLAVNY